MRLLRDLELYGLLISPNPIVSGLARKDLIIGDIDSPIQPCSIDLHVGEIFSPPADPKELNDDPIAQSRHVLKPGATAVVRTKETLNLPGLIAGIGFPPARISAQGILTTNPGHVDPGYQGKLHLTIINMGRKDYPLIQGDPILTLLFFLLDENVEVDYQTLLSSRTKDGKQESTSHKSGDVSKTMQPTSVRKRDYVETILENLAPTFINYEVLAKEAAEEQFRQEKEEAEKVFIRRDTWFKLAGIFVLIIGSLFTGIFGYLNSENNARLQKLEDRFTRQDDVKKAQDELKVLQDELKNTRDELNKIRGQLQGTNINSNRSGQASGGNR
jgi:deoxycytidine triphosphate deaminase